jgi:hypothetical protein
MTKSLKKVLLTFLTILLLNLTTFTQSRNALSQTIDATNTGNILYNSGTGRPNAIILVTSGTSANTIITNVQIIGTEAYYNIPAIYIWYDMGWAWTFNFQIFPFIDGIICVGII